MLRVLGLDVEAWLWPSYSCMASANRPSNDICDLGLGFFFCVLGLRKPAAFLV